MTGPAALLAASARRRWSPLDLTPHTFFDALSLVLAAGANVDTWPDLSGNGHDAIGGVVRPIYRPVGLNGRPTVEGGFHVAALMDTAAFAEVPQPLTMVTVSQAITTAGNRTLIGSTVAANRARAGFTVDGLFRLYAGSQKNTSVAVGTDAHLDECFYSPSSSVLYRDGAAVYSSGAAGTNGTDRLRLWNVAGDSQRAHAYLSAFILVSRALTPAERSALHSWSRQRYGTP